MKKGYLTDQQVWRADGALITEGDYMVGSALDLTLNGTPDDSTPDEDEEETVRIVVTS